MRVCPKRRLRDHCKSTTSTRPVGEHSLSVPGLPSVSFSRRTLRSCSTYPGSPEIKAPVVHPQDIHSEYPMHRPKYHFDLRSDSPSLPLRLAESLARASARQTTRQVAPVRYLVRLHSSPPRCKPSASTRKGCPSGSGCKCKPQNLAMQMPSRQCQSTNLIRDCPTSAPSVHTQHALHCNSVQYHTPTYLGARCI